VKDLKSGSTYQVTLMVYDQAGNVTSTQLTFGAADVGGCTMCAHPCPLSYLSLALIGLALFFMRRRTCVLRTGRISR
jgi:hypothetical protein